MKNFKRPEVIISLIIAVAVIAGAVLYFKTPVGGGGALGGLTDSTTPAPEITSPDGFINTGGEPITFSQFKGKKVVLVDFWTYSCINCQRTIPYLNAWYDKYAADGLEIVGIHTPEFSFEKVQKNVESAVAQYGIKYPVVLDNEYGTWNAFGNQFWPREYLIDIHGNIVYDHTGEGNYDETESAIRAALADRAKVLGLGGMPATSTAAENVDAVAITPNLIASPETYFGSARNQFLANGSIGQSGLQSLTIPKDIQLNSLNLGGTWNFFPEYAENSGETKISYKWSAKNMYFVASAKDPSKPVAMKVLIDGHAPGGEAGADVSAAGTLMIGESRLYHLIGENSYGTHTVEIYIPAGATIDAFTFTFG